MQDIEECFDIAPVGVIVIFFLEAGFDLVVACGSKARCRTIGIVDIAFFLAELTFDGGVVDHFDHGVKTQRNRSFAVIKDDFVESGFGN